MDALIIKCGLGDDNDDDLCKHQGIILKHLNTEERFCAHAPLYTHVSKHASAHTNIYLSYYHHIFSARLSSQVDGYSKMPTK